MVAKAIANSIHIHRDVSHELSENQHLRLKVMKLKEKTIDLQKEMVN